MLCFRASPIGPRTSWVSWDSLSAGSRLVWLAQLCGHLLCFGAQHVRATVLLVRTDAGHAFVEPGRELFHRHQLHVNTRLVIRAVACADCLAEPATAGGRLQISDVAVEN